MNCPVETARVWSNNSHYTFEHHYKMSNHYIADMIERSEWWRTWQCVFSLILPVRHCQWHLCVTDASLSAVNFLFFSLSGWVQSFSFCFVFARSPRYHQSPGKTLPYMTRLLLNSTFEPACCVLLHSRLSLLYGTHGRCVTQIRKLLRADSGAHL